MLNRWVRTWGCAVRTEHWLELDCLDFETGSVEMLFVFGYCKKMWPRVGNNQVFVYLPQTAKKRSRCNRRVNSEAKFANQEPNNMSPRSHQMQWRPCQQKNRGESFVNWGWKRLGLFCQVAPKSKLQMMYLDLWPAFWTTLFEQRECQVKTSLAWQVNFGNGMEWRQWHLGEPWNNCAWIAGHLAEMVPKMEV